MPNRERTARLSQFTKVSPPSFQKAVVFCLVLPLSNPGTWVTYSPRNLSFLAWDAQGPRISASSQFLNVRMELSLQPCGALPFPAEAECTAQSLTHLRPQPSELSESSWQVEPLALPALVQNPHLVVGWAGLML